MLLSYEKIYKRIYADYIYILHHFGHRVSIFGILYHHAYMELCEPAWRTFRSVFVEPYKSLARRQRATGYGQHHGHSGIFIYSGNAVHYFMVSSKFQDTYHSADYMDTVSARRPLVRRQMGVSVYASHSLKHHFCSSPTPAACRTSRVRPHAASVSLDPRHIFFALSAPLTALFPRPEVPHADR